ncbi:hypothetical protein [Rugamonas apoptosis]|uniref:Uncharacterized protein n=1 Tax=Rugamonas apoptosis TaxID=2758570 RepID=A0A7W2F7N9_9BURK|nr:hypothetical protein [Rugamonas apoptosis]MBA5686653.1 hypothetical protein [Rugamonas apoptosis]
MQKLISELIRLYLPSQATAATAANTADMLARRMAGQPAPALRLTTDDGRTRAIVIHFNHTAGAGQEQHWTRLCAVANALQTELGLPAPAVSISGAGYDLWLSLEVPAPPAQVDTFLALLHAAYLPETDAPRMRTGSAAAAAAGMAAAEATGARPAAAADELPPCPLPGGEKWAAFIHPELGASFADEPALEIAPPPAGQAALLDKLHSISTAQFEHALQQLQRAHSKPATGTPTDATSAIPTGIPAGAQASAHAGASATGTPAGAPDRACATICATAPDAYAATPPGLLLKDATLDDIVRFLHARNIEPTFRHLLPK